MKERHKCWEARVDRLSHPPVPASTSTTADWQNACGCTENDERRTNDPGFKKAGRPIGVLTGGGDVPGLNAAIKALVYHAEPEHIRVTRLRSGWEGITFLDRSRRKEDLVFHSEHVHRKTGLFLL